MMASTDSAPTPIYVGTRVLIRPYSPADIPSIAREANDPLVARYMRNLFPSPYTTADAEAWIDIATARKPLRNFALCDAASTQGGGGGYVGGIGLKVMGDVECRTMEIGYWMGPDHWGKGIATEALAAFSRWAFETVRVPVEGEAEEDKEGGGDGAEKGLELLRLEAGVFDGNVGSRRVLEKAGYTFEGTRRRAVWKNGQVLDIHIYSLLREECLGGGGVQS